MRPLYPINSAESPRKILSVDFEMELPIRGGWGYTLADACIIDKKDPIVDSSQPFNGVSLEYIFVEKRIYEEMIIFRLDGEKFSGIKWNLKEQSLLEEGGKYFDRLVFDITAFHDDDWLKLKSEFEGPQGIDHPDFDGQAHEKNRQEKMLRISREFWFDITSFYAQGLIITDKTTGKEKLLPRETFKLKNKLKKFFKAD